MPGSLLPLFSATYALSLLFYAGSSAVCHARYAIYAVICLWRHVAIATIDAACGMTTICRRLLARVVQRHAVCNRLCHAVKTRELSTQAECLSTLEWMFAKCGSYLMLTLPRPSIVHQNVKHITLFAHKHEECPLSLRAAHLSTYCPYTLSLFVTDICFPANRVIERL